ncbi:MAG: DUF2304 domain-containing protein [Solirubrobacteraceae bacterium]
MSTQLRVIAILVSLALFLAVVELVRRRRLLERYALLWLTATVALTGLSIWSGLLDRLSTAIGVRYGTSTLFAVAFGFLTLMVLHFTLVISRLVEQNKILAQRFALLQGRLERLEDGASRGGEDRGEGGHTGRRTALPAAPDLSMRSDDRSAGQPQRRATTTDREPQAAEGHATCPDPDASTREPRPTVLTGDRRRPE